MACNLDRRVDGSHEKRDRLTYWRGGIGVRVLHGDGVPKLPEMKVLL